jgi:hypothetical protein
VAHPRLWLLVSLGQRRIEEESVRIASGLCQVVMLAYLGYRAFTTFVIMPFLATLLSAGSLYFLELLFLAIVVTVLSFLKRDTLAVSLAACLCLISLIYWWAIMCRMGSPIWSDFGWFVVPEWIFGVATYLKYTIMKLRGAPAMA